MTMLSPRPRSTAADLMRLLATWLAAIVLLQGLGAALVLGSGPLHGHRPGGHHHAHSAGERHHHAASDSSVVADPDIADALEAAGLALAGLLSLTAPATRGACADDRRHDRPATEPHWPRGTHPEPPLHPPRLA